MAMATITIATKLKIENQRSRLNGLWTEEPAVPISLIVLVSDAELIALSTPEDFAVDQARSRLIDHRTIHVPILVRNAAQQVGQYESRSDALRPPCLGGQRPPWSSPGC